MPAIRTPRITELELLQDIERDAGQAFAEIGMGEIADAEPLSVAELEQFRRDGRAWIATDARDVAIAYLLSTVVDRCAHIEQVSVARSARSRGIGALLIDHLGQTATAEGREWVTLTTFRDVPWNAPYYQRLGFTTVNIPGQGRELADLVAREASSSLGGFPRVAMKRRAESPA